MIDIHTEICLCACHDPRYKNIRHNAQCCDGLCAYCQTHIKAGMMSEHVQKTHPSGTRPAKPPPIPNKR